MTADMPTIRPTITIEYPNRTVTGPMLYDASTGLLAHVDAAAGESEVLTVDLLAEGLIPGPGESLIKDWSEHAGYAKALEQAGIVRLIDTVNVGPFGSTAYLVEILREAAR